MMTAYEARKQMEKKHVAKMVATQIYFHIENNFGVTVEELRPMFSSERFANHWECPANTDLEILMTLADLANALGADTSAEIMAHVSSQLDSGFYFMGFHDICGFMHRWVRDRLAA